MQRIDFKNQTYTETRKLQERLVAQRLSGEIGDTFLFGEHPQTITLGRRTAPKDLGLPAEEWERRGVSVVAVDRGGSATYHGPGQLVIYPVISLPERKLGVRSFVELVLDVISGSLNGLGLPAGTDLCDTGVWIGGGAERRKIAAAGLRIVHGVTNHGFSLNIDCRLEPYRMFRPCGFPGSSATTIEAELGAGKLDRIEYVRHLKAAIMDSVAGNTGAQDVAGAASASTQTHNSFRGV